MYLAIAVRIFRYWEIERVLVTWTAQEQCLHVGDEGLLAQVEADHFRHVGVGGLVVRDAGTDRVGDRHVAGTIGF